MLNIRKQIYSDLSIEECNSRINEFIEPNNHFSLRKTMFSSGSPITGKVSNSKFKLRNNWPGASIYIVGNIEQKNEHAVIDAKLFPPLWAFILFTFVPIIILFQTSSYEIALFWFIFCCVALAIHLWSANKIFRRLETLLGNQALKRSPAEAGQ